MNLNLKSMKNLFLLILISSIPFLSMSQKRSKKGVKKNTDISVAYDFMVIKGAEIDMSQDLTNGISQEERDQITRDVSLEMKMKKYIKAPSKLIVSFESTDMRGKEIGEMMRKSNEIRTMPAAVKLAASYGWEFINASVLSNDDGVIHYYYMKRNIKK
tara:strand:- start:112 stop:585 length:474 start_codon:yes stop_codon:yes gene_type:complete